MNSEKQLDSRFHPALPTTIFIGLASLLLICSIAICAPPQAQDTSPVDVQPQAAAVVINLDKTVPGKLDLTVGKEVVFIRKQSEGVGIEVSTNSRVLASNFAPRAPFQLKAGYEIIGQFKATGPGNADIEVVRTVVTPTATPQKQTIAVTVKAVKAARPAPVVVDLNQPIPASIDLAVGQEVVFENGPAAVSAKDTDNGGVLLDSRPHNTLNQVAAYRAKRIGSGEINIDLPSKGQIQVIVPFTIKVTVKAIKAAKPAPVVVDLNQPIPASIALAVGQEVVFENGPATVSAKDTDNGGVLLDSRPHKTLNQVAAYRAKRIGSGEINIDLPSKGQIQVIVPFTIKVTVK